MLDWLVGTCNLFGLPCQNWMLLIDAGLVLYIVTLLAASRRHPARR